MEVRNISTEIIKPSSPTPSHLRVYKLSVLDQLSPDIYVSLILFYSGNSCKITTNASQSDRLKKSLSETLTHYYPFAGRADDAKSVNCDDSGATFIETHVADTIAEILKQPQVDMLAKLCPCNVANNTLSGQPNLAVQINRFDCGGVAIAVTLRHLIADASAAANFVKNWAAIALGGSDHHIANNDVVFDCSSFFPPPEEFSDVIKSASENRCLAKEAVRKRFTFGGAKISALREKINEGSGNLERPTRFEAVSTLILGAVIAAVKERDQLTRPKYLAVFIPLNLRKRTNPPFPEQCIGNISLPTIITLPLEKTESDDYKCLAGKLRDSIRMFDENYVRKLQEGGAYVDHLRKAVTKILTATEVERFTISSWSRFPFYEADFGWGKPMWVSTSFHLDNMASLLDSCDGQGIEAWVELSKEDMDKFEQDPGIMTFTTSNPSI